ncbi:MAG: hypothetical protein QM723_39655 [Myxococcaceae bacterium]
MRGLLVLVVLALARPAWAQLDEGLVPAPREASEAKPPSCAWCIAVELGISLGAELLLVGAGAGLTAATGNSWNSLILLPAGAALGLLAAFAPIAVYVGRYDGHPPWVGAAIGTGFALIFGPVVAFWLLSNSINDSSASSRTAKLAGAIAATVLCPGFVVLAVEFERSSRITPSVALLPGGGAVVVTATF